MLASITSAIHSSVTPNAGVRRFNYALVTTIMGLQASVAFHVYTAILFTRSDFKTILFPVVSLKSQAERSDDH